MHSLVLMGGKFYIYFYHEAHMDTSDRKSIKAYQLCIMVKRYYIIIIVKDKLKGNKGER